MPKHLFIINPVAGGEDSAAALRARIIALMGARREPEYLIGRTTHPGHAAELVREHTADGCDWRVYACGGDGTLNEVACAAAGLAHVAVTHCPCGTGNDFIKIFGAGAARFSELSELVDGTVLSLDLIEVDDGTDTVRYALNIASVGFDARVAAEMHRFKRKHARLSAKRHYDLSVVYNLFHGIHRPYEVYIDGVSLPDTRYTLMLAANGRWYGGGYNPVPEARPDDGMLDFLMAGPVSVFGLARMIGRFSKGQYGDLPEIFTYARGRRMEVVCSGPEPVNVDGEIFMAQRVAFSVAPVKLNFVAPRGAGWSAESGQLRVESGKAKAES